MKKAVIVILIILGLSLCSNIALAYTQEAKAGNFIPLRFTNTHITTSGWPIIGQWTKGWEPARVRFYLIDPYGHVGATTECGGKSSPTSATYKFTPPNAGTFKLQIWSHDASGRETEKPAEITIEVYQGNKPIPPIVTDDLALWLVIAIIAIAGIGIGMYVLQNRKKGGGMKFKIPKFNMPKWRKKK